MITSCLEKAASWHHLDKLGKHYQPRRPVFALLLWTATNSTSSTTLTLLASTTWEQYQQRKHRQLVRMYTLQSARFKEQKVGVGWSMTIKCRCHGTGMDLTISCRRRSWQFKIHQFAMEIASTNDDFGKLYCNLVTTKIIGLLGKRNRFLKINIMTSTMIFISK